MRQEIIVMNVSQYDFVDQEKERRKGTSVYYAITNVLDPCEDGAIKGYRLAKTSMEYDDFERFKVVPAIYEADLKFNINSKGDAKLAASNFEYKRNVVLADMKAPVK